MTATTGRIRRYGTAARNTRVHEKGRRRRAGRPSSAATAVPSGTWLLVNEIHVPSRCYFWFSVNAMLSLATSAACLTVILLVRIRDSMVRSTLPFSTLTQCFAVGTNQLRRAARSFTLDPRRLVVFGMLPFARSAVIDALSVNARIQAAALDLSAPTGTARSEPPRKPGMGWPLVRLGMTNWAVFDLWLPTQQLNHPGPIIAAAFPCAYTSYGFGLVSSVVFDAREAAL